MEGSAHGIDTSSPANPVLATKVPKKLKGVNVRDSIISTDSDKPSDGTTESSDAIPKLNCWSHWDRKLMEANMNPERLKRIFDNRKAAKKFINKKADYSTKLKAQIMEFEGITYRLKIQVAMAMEAYMKQQKENHDMKMRVAVLELEEDDFLFNKNERDRLYKQLQEQEQQQQQIEEKKQKIEQLKEFLLETSTS